MKQGDIFTIYVDSVKSNYTEYFPEYTKNAPYLVEPYEARYVVGEEVLVHIRKEDPNILKQVIEHIDKEDEYIIGGYYRTALGTLGKYTIKDGLAYNKYPYGVPIQYVAYKALP